MRISTKLSSTILTLLLCFLLSCAGTAYDFQNPKAEILKVPIVFHVRSQHDLKKRIPAYWKRYSQPAFWDGKIHPVIDEIKFDVPHIRPDIDSRQVRQSFYNMSGDGRIHIFFVNAIYDRGAIQRSYRGIQIREGMCNSFILIPDLTNPKTIAHEIGHHLGLDHEKDFEGNIMNNKRHIDAQFSNIQFYIMRRKIKEQRILCHMPKTVNSRPKIH